ncbi:hypothetical protein AALP_AAs41943U000100, partial [Arabis alpina]
ENHCSKYTKNIDQDEQFVKEPIVLLAQ